MDLVGCPTRFHATLPVVVLQVGVMVMVPGMPTDVLAELPLTTIVPLHDAEPPDKLSSAT